ncbi:MAG: dihydropteroate synthase [Candidatus Delongbacteria bacterium]|nr:dihydropteroate synthase [Candidatus Delongbacteria bacterium]MBN2835874.1 dihydropteroate synthase [Candidatus Delongbacteria bacterium]
MGILNITPDSFSDGNRFISYDNALKHCEVMLREGADIIDIGGESSRPGALPVSEQEELDRILHISEAIYKNFQCCISVDTYKSRVSDECLKVGASMINDIYGLTKEPQIAETVAKYNAGLCLMHMRGNPEIMQKDTLYSDILTEINDFLINKADYAISKGVKTESLLLDPGIGFGKSVEDNLKILNNLGLFSERFNVLIGTSRKSFIGSVLNKDADQRLYGTISSNVVSLMNGAIVFRVHDVKEHRDALDLAFEILKAGK